jgi:hypothetical protein
MDVLQAATPTQLIGQVRGVYHQYIQLVCLILTSALYFLFYLLYALWVAAPLLS